MTTRRSFNDSRRLSLQLAPDNLCPITKLFAEHKRDDIQRFGECVMQLHSVEGEEETLFKKLLHFLDLEPTDPVVNPPVTLMFNSRSTFMEDANRASENIKQSKGECLSLASTT